MSYFESHDEVERPGRIRRIHEKLSKPLTKITLLFLQFVLPILNEFNRLFQNEESKVGVLIPEMDRLERQFLIKFVLARHIRDVVDLRSRLHGPRHPARRLYARSESEGSVVLRRQHWSRAGSVCQGGACLLLCRRHQDGHQDGRQVPHHVWADILAMKTPLGVNRLPLMATVMAPLLSLPHSNADVERLFSILRKVHTEARHSLNADTITAYLQCKLNIDTCCYELDVSEEMLKLAKSATHAV